MKQPSPDDSAVHEFFEQVIHREPREQELWFAEHPHLAEELKSLMRVDRRLRAEVDDGSTGESPFATVDLMSSRSSSGAAQDPLAGFELPESLGDYELLEVISRGGMGIVFKARQRSLNRIVALKMILAGSLAGSEEVQRFRAEALAAASLTHPGIVRIYDVGQERGRYFFTMRYVDGESLAARLERGPLPPEEAARLIQRVARAVDYAHARGIVHRDVKPGNVLLDVEGVPSLSDFGLAKWSELRNDLTMTGQILGTPNYMAPEQAAGDSQQVGGLSDVYSLGAVLYACLTGHPVFQSASVADTIQQVRQQEPVAPCQLNPQIPKDLETICLKCLRKAPQQRYDSAGALADDLKRFLGHEPIAARPLTALERFRQWRRRNPAIAVMTIALMTAVVIVAVVSMTAAVGLKIARSESQRNEERALAAEREKTEQLWRSYRDQARAQRWSGRAGRSYVSLQVLQQAAQIRPDQSLRNEAIAAMSIPDVSAVREWTVVDEQIATAAVNADYSQLAYARTDGVTIICETAEGKPVGQLPARGEQVSGLRFGPAGKYLAVKYQPGNRIVLWEIQDARPQWEFDDVREFSFDFSPDGDRVALGRHDRSLAIVETSSGREVTRWPVSIDPYHLRFDPAGERLAVSSETGVVEIHDTFSASRLMVLPSNGGIRAVAWHPYGKLLAGGGTDFGVHLWNVETGQLQSRFVGHESQVTSVAFSEEDGRFLLSHGWDGSLRLWDVLGAEQLLNVQNFNTFYQPALQVSLDNQYVGFEVLGSQLRLWGLHPADECIVLSTPAGEPHRFIQSIDVTPDGHFLAAATVGSVHFWNLRTHQWQGALGLVPATRVAFDPQQKWFLTAGSAGALQWPLHPVSAPTLPQGEEAADCDIGTPRWLGTAPGEVIVMAVSADGQMVVLGNRHGKVTLFDRDDRPLRELSPSLKDIVSLAISTDSRWIAASSWGGDWMVWNAETGQQVESFSEEATPVGFVTFSPDGQWLVVGTQVDFQFFRMGSWERGPRIQRKGGKPLLVFSEDGRMVCCTESRHQLRLLEAETLQEVARFEASNSHLISTLAFTPDGTRVLVGTEAHKIHLWDFAAIRDRLAGMQLDWTTTSWPAHVSPNARASGRIRLQGSESELNPHVHFFCLAGQALANQRPHETIELLHLIVQLERPQVYSSAHILLPALLAQHGRTDEYHDFCRRMLDLHERSADLWSLERLSKSCLLVPLPEDALQRVSAVVDRLCAAGPVHPSYQWAEATRALARLRRANYAEAINDCDQVLAKPGRLWYRSMLARFVRAIALARQGRTDEAIRDLELAREGWAVKRREYHEQPFGMDHFHLPMFELMEQQATEAVAEARATVESP